MSEPDVERGPVARLAAFGAALVAVFAVSVALGQVTGDVAADPPAHAPSDRTHR